MLQPAQDDQRQEMEKTKNGDRVPSFLASQESADGSQVPRPAKRLLHPREERPHHCGNCPRFQEAYAYREIFQVAKVLPNEPGEENALESGRGRVPRRANQEEHRGGPHASPPQHSNWLPLERQLRLALESHDRVEVYLTMARQE